MDIEKRLSERGASEEELRQLETKLGSEFPSDYRQFMSQYNGGRPMPSGVVFETANGQEDCSVRYFLTLDEREERYTIQRFLERFNNRIPRNTLPIACDSFGNLVLLDVGAKSTGAVYFWDHEIENDDENDDEDEPTWDNISVIAPSFTEFLNILE